MTDNPCSLASSSAFAYKVLADTISPYSYSWDTTNGSAHPCIGAHTHALSTKAYDAAGKVTTSIAVTVNMNNPSYCTVTPTPVPPPTPIAGDLNNDKIVNSLDWSMMKLRWFTSDATSDLNDDGIVNSIDFSILNNNWFKTGA